MAMKTIFLGDTHGRSFWKLISALESSWDRMVFIGDYFDTKEDISGEEQVRNFQEIAKFKEKNPDKVFLLIGNHDGYIYDDMDQYTITGHQSGMAPTIKHVLNTYKDLLQMAYYQDNILATHAGVGETWFKNNIPEIEEDWTAKYIAETVNDQWKYKPLSFKFTGWKDNTGDEIGQTPIWIRPSSLMKDSQNIKKSGVIQIAGHTTKNQIDIKGKSTGGKYYFIDTLGTSGEYLIYENNQFKTGKI